MSIDRGSRVVVRMGGKFFPWMGHNNQFEAVLKSSPAGPGDTFELELDDGRTIQLNGNSNHFVGLYKKGGPDR